MTDEKKFFDITMAEPELGKTYPLYGMITEIVSEKPLIVIINNQVEGTCIVEDPEKINLVKERAFEPGIFITNIEQRRDDGMYVGTIQTIVFGKRQTIIQN